MIMTYSMTAFARVQKQLDTGTFCWELRSVNHRYLDLSFRLPDAFRFLETALRAQVRDKLSRGKLECQLRFQEQTGVNQPLRINENLVDGLIEASNQLATTKHLANDLTVTTILSWPNVIQSAQIDVEAIAQHAQDLFQEALAQLLRARKDEGKALQVHVQKRLEALNTVINHAREQTISHTHQAREKLLARLQTLQMTVEDGRIEQEIALMLTRLDVSEELDRLQTHTTEVAKALGSSEASGRRLDFLMQELNREANTLGAKSEAIFLTRSAIEMKVLIEQMREQIQNIE